MMAANLADKIQRAAEVVLISMTIKVIGITLPAHWEAQEVQIEFFPPGITVSHSAIGMLGNCRTIIPGVPVVTEIIIASFFIITEVTEGQIIESGRFEDMGNFCG